MSQEPMPRSHPAATLKPEDGATATEYALLVSFIALALVLGVTFFGTNLNTLFNGFGTSVATIL